MIKFVLKSEKKEKVRGIWFKCGFVGGSGWNWRQGGYGSISVERPSEPTRGGGGEDGRRSENEASGVFCGQSWPGFPLLALLQIPSSTLTPPLGRKSSRVSVTLHITTLSPFACIFSRKGQERKIIDSIWGGEHVTAGICLIKFYLQLHSPWKISEPSTALLTPALYVAKQPGEGRELVVWLSWVFSGSCCEFQDAGRCGDRWSLSEPPSVVQSGSITAGMLAAS